MESPVSENVRESLQQAIKEAKASDDRTSRSGSASAEVLRLQNALKFKEKELDDARKEVSALKSTLNTKDRALQSTEQEFRLLKERNVATEGELANMAKELAALKVDKRKTEAHLSTLMRRGDKEQANGNDGGAFGSVPSSEHMAALQADLRSARMDGEKAAEGVKALENLLRAKDRHITALQRKADEGDAYRLKCGELENKLLEANRQMDEMRAAARIQAETLRARDAENSRLTADLNKARAALNAAAEAAARSSAALKASEVRCTALEQEVGTLVTQLARTSVVAQRVAASEVKAGCKDEGVVHVTRHLEEIRFMSGEVVRLQQRISSLEKELAVSDELKERYRSQSQAGASAQDSPSSPCATPVFRPASRTSSRTSSTPRRPVSASISPRPYTAPRVRTSTALRASAADAMGLGGEAADAVDTTTTATADAATADAAGEGEGSSPAIESPPAVRSSIGGSTVRRLSKPLPWNSPAKTPVAGAAVGGAGVLARSGAKIGPSVRSPPGLAGVAARPRSAGSGAGVAYKGAAVVRKSAGGIALARVASGRGGASAAAAAGAAAAAAEDDASAAAAASLGTQTSEGGVAGGDSGLESHPVVSDGESGSGTAAGEAAAGSSSGEAVVEKAEGEAQVGGGEGLEEEGGREAAEVAGVAGTAEVPGVTDLSGVVGMSGAAEVPGPAEVPPAAEVAAASEAPAATERRRVKLLAQLWETSPARGT